MTRFAGTKFSDMLLYAREQTTMHLAARHRGERLLLPLLLLFSKCLADGLYGIEVKSKSKSFMLCTPNETEQRKWVDAITDAVAKDRETRHSRLPSKHRRNTEKQARFGDTAPVWIPDHDVSMCQTCAAEFNLVRRRHHCRACGKVVCSACSGESVPLAYLNNERGRVCPECFENYTKTTSKESAALMADRKRSRRKRTVDRQQSMRAVTSSKLHRPIDLDDKFIVCSSYVFEQGKFRKQRRWLLLRSDGVLFTFKAHSGEGQEQEYGVRLHKPLLKDYVFFCEQKDQADRWLEALTAAVESELPEWFDGEVYSDERDVATEPLQEEQEEGEGEGEGDQQQQVRHFHVNDQATGSQA
ncbi:hypothetical protein PTSG_03082 [Salpingoeca rosetta]|uniref:Uncharacterized protein n=1 Tax=Salpingoeca rosetta (strain ATCC 50818 / BSB-021) TaxID=946362 RepID=F2U470_SALR5|nr:uncharacterized protein PTSG_03082 [Salpingoeca rosetta]EGD82436.1 hypothetical protein PTSG_03082 [Salpingoeca rosetta]|eukprot:XP_004995672.1 hypothetical protein PTSG_03082 [Salpingoeca rosetta]